MDSSKLNLSEMVKPTKSPTENSAGITRRHFVKSVAASGVAIGVGANAWSEETKKGDMLYRTLGRTGEKVSAIGMGGFHIAQHSLTEDDSIRLIRSAIDRGITFMDNSWDYNEGQSEIRMGKALKDGYREKVFLMTKIDGRTKETAARQIDTCLERLQTDHIDLVQHHEIIRFDDPNRIFAEKGANEAVVAAQKAGK